MKKVTSIKCWNSWVKVLCEHTRSLELGKRVYEILRRSTFRGDVELSNRLIRMYCKCGSVKNARQVFDQMPDKKIAS